MNNGVNPLQLVQMIKSGMNPQQLMLSMLEQRMGGTPMGTNLINLAKSNNGAGIEQFARNLCAQQGVDFDKEFNQFKQQLGFK